MYSSVHYPGDYGFIPCTLGEDGDPIDVLILVSEHSFPGCLIEVRPVGLLDMLDEGAADEKLLAVATGNPHFADVRDYSGIYPHVLREIENFFAIYKELEGASTEVTGWRDALEALTYIEASRKRFLEHR